MGKVDSAKGWRAYKPSNSQSLLKEERFKWPKRVKFNDEVIYLTFNSQQKLLE